MDRMYRKFRLRLFNSSKISRDFPVNIFSFEQSLNAKPSKRVTKQTEDDVFFYLVMSGFERKKHIVPKGLNKIYLL